MSQMLPDGSILPQNLRPHGPLVESRSEMTLRMGRICATYDPTDQANLSKKFIEYDVLADYIDYNGIYSSVLFPRCKVVSRFGGAADFEFFTYRESTIDPSQKSTLETGDIVLVLCINGDRRGGMIVGGLPHSMLDNNSNYKNLALAPGSNYVWEFNGAIINVNDDGEFTLKFTGATQNDGTPLSSVNTSNALTTILFDKNGQLIMSTGANNFIQIQNNDNNTIIVNADNVVNVVTNSGNINLTPNNMTAGVFIGGASDFMLKGTTYRTDQTTMDTAIVTALGTLSTELTSAGADLAAASSLFNILGGLCDTPPLTPLGAPLTQVGVSMASAGATLSSATTSIAAIIAAIQAFEAQVLNQVSLRHKND